MSGGGIHSFPGLRPHQRPAWHMFLVQLAALALDKARLDGFPADESMWLTLLKGLTPGFPNDEPWHLAVDSRSVPAFMQPPDPGGLKWSQRSTPDALDMLITARNHDLKKSVARNVQAEDWVFALVSLQTCEGYGGRGNYGIARMNGGASSRPLVGLVPSDGEHSIDASRHWQRDVSLLLANRRETTPPLGKLGADALLWLLPWPERTPLELDALDPWFIEVCRRVRLVSREGVFSAECASSVAPRTNAKPFHGNVGDPWIPVERKGGKEGKSLTISARDFDYKRICDLLYSGDWKLPLLASATQGESGDMLLLTEAICRGNKTEGFKSRTVPVPREHVSMFASDEVGRLAKAQMEEVAAFNKALRDGLAVAAAGGEPSAIGRAHYAFTNAPRARFERAADVIFFPALWSRVDAAGDSDGADAKQTFLADLKRRADRVFAEALPQMPCRAIHRRRAEARAKSRYERTLRNEGATQGLFNEQEEVDAKS